MTAPLSRRRLLFLHTAPTLPVRTLLTVASLVAMSAMAAHAAPPKVGQGGACASDHGLAFGDPVALTMGRARVQFTPAPSPATASAAAAVATVTAVFEPDAAAGAGKGAERVPMPLRPASVRSSLVSFSDVTVWEGQRTVWPWRLMVLAAMPAGEPPQVLAAMATGEGQVRFAWAPSSARGAADAQYRITALEHLYTYVHRQDPLLRFGVSAKAAPAGTAAGSQAAAQASIARARHCLIAQLGERKQAVRPWQWASLVLDAPVKGEPLRVSARARDAQGRPVRNANVAFARGEHFACGAMTDDKGVARCTMFDPHGHAQDDGDVHAGEEDTEPTVVTFGGIDAAQSVLLPRTLVVQPSKAGTRKKHGH